MSFSNDLTPLWTTKDQVVVVDGGTETTKPGIGGDGGAVLDQWRFIMPGAMVEDRSMWVIGDPPDVDFATEGIEDQSWSIRP